MSQLEENITQSFTLVRNDIIELRASIRELQENHSRMLDLVNRAKAEGQIISIKEQPKSVSFVASRAGKSVHEPKCPFAKNIKPGMKISFESKSDALAQGYKLCECMNG